MAVLSFRPVVMSYISNPLCYRDITVLLLGYYQSMLWLNQELTASMICGVVFRD